MKKSLIFFNHSSYSWVCFCLMFLYQGVFLMLSLPSSFCPGRHWWNVSRTLLWPDWYLPSWGSKISACSPPTQWESSCGDMRTLCSNMPKQLTLQSMTFSDFSTRAMLRVMENMSSSLASRTTWTLPEWTHGRAAGTFLPSLSTVS